MEENENKPVQSETEIQEKNEELKYKGPKKVALSALNGFFVGLAVILPGISGAAISMMFKLYDKMIFAIANIFKKFGTCFLFLLPILLGAAVGFLLGFFTIQQLIDDYLFICVAFFAGLMLGGTQEVYKEIRVNDIKQHKWYDWLLLVIGVCLPIVLSIIFVAVGESSLLTGAIQADSFPVWLYFLMILIGIVLSLTQIIPGLSATALLMSLGLFTPIMESVHFSVISEKPTWLLIYLMLVIGFVIGMLAFSKLINYLLMKFRFTTFHLLTGLAFGSVAAMFYNVETVEVYRSWAIGEGHMALDLGVGIPLFFVGLGIIILIIFLSKKFAAKNDTK